MDGDATWDNKVVVAALQPISRCPAYILLPQSSTLGNTFLASVPKFPSLFSCFVLLHWPELFSLFSITGPLCTEDALGQ